eukprot:GHUV01003712.1.p1 GENE.GHUV01003712.1~~GHUV01003712.1.p1  ORF type:complete len:140 (+),score=31.25 GHUV01003712.1:266-685(+)
MPRFGDVAALTSYLHRLDEDYDAYAQALWASGIRRSEQLANNTVAALMTAGISNELHAGDIKARSGGDIAGVPAWVRWAPFTVMLCLIIGLVLMTLGLDQWHTWKLSPMEMLGILGSFPLVGGAYKVDWPWNWLVKVLL